MSLRRTLVAGGGSLRPARAELTMLPRRPSWTSGCQGFLLQLAEVRKTVGEENWSLSVVEGLGLGCVAADCGIRDSGRGGVECAKRTLQLLERDADTRARAAAGASGDVVGLDASVRDDAPGSQAAP